MTIKGKKQGLISSGCSTQKSIGNLFQNWKKDKIYIYELNHSLSRDQNVSHFPIMIKKPLDKSTLLLGMAISNNEELDCIFDLYRTEGNGCLTLYFQIKITKATISNIDMICPNSLTHNECQPQEIISLKYESISWQHFLAGTSGYSIWNERDY